MAGVQSPLDASVLPAQRDFEVRAARALACLLWILAVNQLEAMQDEVIPDFAGLTSVRLELLVRHFEPIHLEGARHRP